jgi:tetratricopeptide (TPR) repeat protein
VRCELLTALGTAQAQAGLPEHRDPLREAGRIALRLGDRDLLVTVALARTPGIESMAEVDPERLAVLDAALAAVGPADGIERARLLACLAEEIDPRDAARRCAVAGEAIDVAHRIDDDATTLAVLTLALNPFNTPDTLDRRLHESELALELADRFGNVSAGFQARSYLMVAAGEVGDIDEFDAHLTEMEGIGDQTNLPIHRYQIHMFRSWRHLLAGRTTEAEADALAALDIGTKIGLSFAAGTYGSHLLQRAIQQGQLADLVDLVAEGAAQNPTIPAWRTALMAVYNELGRSNEAAALFDIGERTEFSDLPFNETWLQTATQYAECAADLGRTDAAPQLYDQLLPYAARFVFVFSLDWGAAARPLGRLATLLGRYDDAETHLRDALVMHERIQAPFWIARTRIDQAELCLTRGAADDVATARDHLDQVQRIVDEYGYAGLQLRIDRLAADL